MDAFFDDEPGYRIRPDEFALPDISLDADEAAVIGLATKVWEHARLAEATTEAVRKLTAAGVDARRLRPRHRRAAAERRRAVVRRLLGGHPGAHAGRVRLPPLRRRRAAPPATSSRGASCATPVAGTSSASTPTAARSGSSGSPACRAGPRRSGGPARTTCRPAPTCAPPPAGSRRRPPTERAVVLVRRGAGHALRRDADLRRAGRRRPRRAHGLGPAVGDAQRGRRSPTSCSATAPTCTSRSPRRCASDVVDRLRAAAGGARVSGAAATGGAKDQVARLLTLVPFLHARGEVRLEDAAAALGVPRRPAAQGPQGAADVRPAGRLPRRPDRRRPRRARGRGGRRRHPGVERRLPGPPAAALARPRRPRSSSRCARCATAPATRPARSWTGRWPSSRPRPPRGSRTRRADRPGRRPGGPRRRRAAAQPLRGRRRPAAAGAADLLRALARRAVRARRRPARRRHRPRLRLPRRLVPQRRGAAALPARPDPRGRRCSTTRDRDARRGAARPRPTGSSPRPATPRWSPLRPRRPRPAGSSSTTRSRRSAPLADGGVEVDLLVADERWLPAPAAAAGPARAGSSSPHRFAADVHRRRAGRARPLRSPAA